MGIEIGTALLIASLASGASQAVSSLSAKKTAGDAKAAANLEQKKLEDAQKVNEIQTANLIKKNKGGGGGKNTARDTILTGPNLGGTPTGKTLLGA